MDVSINRPNEGSLQGLWILLYFFFSVPTTVVVKCINTLEPSFWPASYITLNNHICGASPRSLLRLLLALSLAPNPVRSGLSAGAATEGARPLLHFILWLRTCLLVEAQPILHLDQGISSFLLQIYLRPPFKKYPVAPLSIFFWPAIVCQSLFSGLSSISFRIVFSS